ncbi:MAG TPA: DMT family transporter [Candidatus Binatia bacterium]
MAEYFSLQAALFFATSHVLIRRGLATSNAVTGAFVSLGLTALILWALLPFFTPLSDLRTPAVWVFLAAGLFAPGIGRTLTYVGIEKLGVARSTPISNASPMFASVLAVFVLGEIWSPVNFLGTALVISGIAILSGARGGKGRWRRLDLVYPVVAAVVFGVSTNLRKLGLTIASRPLMAAAVTATTAFVFVVCLLQARGGLPALKLSRSNYRWFFAAGFANTAATLSVFHALSFGEVVVVEPLVASNPVFSLIMSAVFLKDLETITPRVVAGALCTVAGTVLVVLR